MPPSSPPAPFDDLDEDEEVVNDEEEEEMRARGRARDQGDDEDDEEGEDLFNDNMVKSVPPHSILMACTCALTPAATTIRTRRWTPTPKQTSTTTPTWRN